MKKQIKLLKKYTKYHAEEIEEPYYVDKWWVKFLKWLFEDSWYTFKQDWITEARAEARLTIKESMRDYARQLDQEILKQVELVEPTFRVKEYRDLEIPDIAPSPNIINGIAYPKRLIIKKSK